MSTEPVKEKGNPKSDATPKVDALRLLNLSSAHDVPKTLAEWVSALSQSERHARLLVLDVHACLDELMTQFLATHMSAWFRGPDKTADEVAKSLVDACAKLRFVDKIRLLTPILRDRVPTDLDTLEKINTLRNRCAHNRAKIPLDWSGRSLWSDKDAQAEFYLAFFNVATHLEKLQDNLAGLFLQWNLAYDKCERPTLTT